MYATDKQVVGYVPEYQRIAGILGPAARVCELGVLNGLGLDMLRDMFPQGLIAGVDLNQFSRWPDDTIKVVCPQDDPDLVFHLSNYSAQWDLIIDDASHNGVKTMTSFGLLWPLVSPGGFYVIEDWFIGLPSWPSTGCWDGAPVGSAVVAASYDPELLHAVQNLVTLLDKPYCGVGAPGPFRDSEAESVTFRYGLAIVQKSA